jgi:D-sedoheptulose 7-phosphate isomerase
VKRTSRRGPLEREARAVLLDAGATMRRLEKACTRAVAEAAESLIACLESGGTVYFCGNGGSAADAQHLAAELAGRYLMDRPALAATALTTNSSALTAIGNDFGFDQVFSRQLEGMAMPGDVLVAITTSGGSANIRNAIESAHAMGVVVIGMTGQKGAAFAKLCDVALMTPSASTPRIQEGHIAMGHALCEMIERAMFASEPAPARRAARRKPAARRTAGRHARSARS